MRNKLTMDIDSYVSGAKRIILTITILFSFTDTVTDTEPTRNGGKGSRLN